VTYKILAAGMPFLSLVLIYGLIALVSEQRGICAYLNVGWLKSRK
jgi:hypothetical protein